MDMTVTQSSFVVAVMTGWREVIRRQLGRASLGRARRRRQSSTDLERRWRPCVNADDVQCSLSVCLSAGYCARLPGGPAG